MIEVDLNNRIFCLVSNDDNGEVSSEALFHYKQEKGVVTATYSGGSISSGSIVGAYINSSTLNLLYHCITTSGELRAGKAKTTISILENKCIKLSLDWEWLNGDKSSGQSEYIEID